MSSQTYNLYTSDTSPLTPSQPTGATKLCLSCHDGTVALGSVGNPLPGSPSELVSPLPTGNLSNFGIDLSGHHPVVFSYPRRRDWTQPDNWWTLLFCLSSIILGGTAMSIAQHVMMLMKTPMGNFLSWNNAGISLLCTSCHQLNGWDGSAHATSSFPVAGILPRPPKTFPAWSHMNEWGCEVCHTPHLAATPQKLLNFCSSPRPAPYTSAFDCTTGGCHGAGPTPIHWLQALRRRQRSAPLLFQIPPLPI